MQNSSSQAAYPFSSLLHRLPVWLCRLGIAAALTLTAHTASAGNTDKPVPAFTQKDASAWIGSQPLDWSNLHGNVVLMHVWTYGCWNCYRSFPWMNELEASYQPQGLRVIGIHTPEFEQEHDVATIRARMKKFGLNHPVMIDNDYRYWEALGNHYWPTYYLVDQQGRIRAQFIGEIHAGDHQAQAVESAIKQLLEEGRTAVGKVPVAERSPPDHS